MSKVLLPADSSADALIVGGGVIGLSIARELASRGLRRVAVIERGEFGREASWAAGGILGPQAEANCIDDFFKLAAASRDLYPAFAESLREETAIDVELDRTGTLYLGFSEHDERELRGRFEWQANADLPVEWLTGDEARRLEPVISPGARCALLFSEDWQLENRKLVEALVAANQKLGVHLIAHCEARSIEVDHGRVTRVATSQGSMNARNVVVAAGAWSSQIATTTGGPRIEPVRGQMLSFKTGGAFTRHLLYSRRGYLVPRRDGRLLAGSTSERVGFEKRVTEEGVELIKAMALEIAPALASVSVVDSWAGFRPHAPDDLPVIGEAGDVAGLFYATGHYRNGILLAPITAKILADEILGMNSSGAMDAFSPNRFRLVAAGG